MRDTKLEKPLITTGIIMVVPAIGMATYSLMGMLCNSAFLETPAGAGWVDFSNAAGKPLVDILENAGVQPVAMCAVLAVVTGLAAISFTIMHVYYVKNPDYNSWGNQFKCCGAQEEGEIARLADTDKSRDKPTMFCAIFAGIFAGLSAGSLGTTIAHQTLPHLGDYTVLTENVAISAGVIGALGIALILLGALPSKNAPLVATRD